MAFHFLIICLVSTVLAGPLIEHGVRKRQLTEANGYDYDTNVQPKEGESNVDAQSGRGYESLVYNRPAVKYKDFDSMNAMSMDEDEFKRPQQQPIAVKSPACVGNSRDDFIGLKDTDEGLNRKIIEQPHNRKVEKFDERRFSAQEKSLYMSPKTENRMIPQESNNKFAIEREPVKAYYSQAKHMQDELRNSGGMKIEKRPPVQRVNYDDEEASYRDEANLKEKRDSNDSDEPDSNGDETPDSDNEQAPVKNKGKRDTSDSEIREPKIILPVLLSSFRSNNSPSEGQEKDQTSKREAGHSPGASYQDSLLTIDDKHRIESALDKLLRDAILQRGSNSFVEPSQNGLELNDLLNEDQLRALIRGTNAVLNNGVGAKKTVSSKSAVRALNYNPVQKDYNSNSGSQCKCQVVNALTVPPNCNAPVKMEEAIVNVEEDSIIVDIKRTTRSPNATCSTTASSSCAVANFNVGLDNRE